MHSDPATLLTLPYLDPADRAARRAAVHALLAECDPAERPTLILDLLRGLPVDALLTNRRSPAACASAQLILHLLMIVPAMIVLWLAATQLGHAGQVLVAGDQAAMLAIAREGAAQIDAAGWAWRLSAGLLAILMPLSWMLMPPRWAQRVHLLALVPLIVAVSVLPGLGVPLAAQLLGLGLTGVALWCIWERPEDRFSSV